MNDNFDDIKIPWGKVFVAFLVVLILSLALDWVFAGQNFFLYKFWAPKTEQVRREVYENTKSFKKGSADRLSNLCGQVDSADSDHKQLLREQIKQEFSDMNTSDAPDYLRPCLSAARAQ